MTRKWAHLQASGNSIDALRNSLNFALTRIGDRLVSLEIGVPTGADGADAITSHLTNEAHVVDADNNGTNYSLTAAAGTHKVYDDTVDKTTTAVHSIVGGGAKNGLTISVISGTGVYSLSGASWVTDSETFTLRAVYGGKTLDKEYSIAKARAGAAGAPVVTLTNQNVSEDRAGEAHAGIRISKNGKSYWKKYVSITQYATGTDWVRPIDFSPGGYEVKATYTGSTLDGGSSATGSWLAIVDAPTNDGYTWWFETTGADKDGTLTLEMRLNGGSVLDSSTHTLHAGTLL